MKKTNLLSKILGGLAIVFSAHSAMAWTGNTHNTIIYEDCSTSSAQIESTFSIYSGGFFGNGNYRTLIKLYKGDWTIAGMGHVVSNETYQTTITSATKYIPLFLSNVFTADFFSSTPTFTVTKNGAYRCTTTLQKDVGGVWTDLFTTPLSTAYGTIDVPPYNQYGDIYEVALVETLKIGLAFDYSVNGVKQVGAAPAFITCTAVPLILDNVENWMGNPGTATLTLQRGYLTGSAFTSTLSSSTTFWSSGASQNLTSLFSLSGYTGALRIIYDLPGDDCYGTLTGVSKSMTITVTTAAFLNDYKAPTGSAVVSSCASSTTTKSVSSTWSITATMPSSTNLNTFKCDLKTATGWQAATSAGIMDLTYAGNYSIDVYEVSPTTGVRMTGAPSLYLKTGTSASNDQVTFGDYGYSAQFDISNPPFYTDVTTPNNAANPLGLGDGYNYFYDFYTAARTNSVTVGNLTSFSARVFCADVSQYPAGGCVVSKKSYFRIANNGAGSGATVRMATSSSDEAEEEYKSLEVYPNPTNGEVMIPVTEDDMNVSVVIMDNLGKQVVSIADVKAKGGAIDIGNLTAGIYFYTINKDNSIYRGKIVKH